MGMGILGILAFIATSLTAVPAPLPATQRVLEVPWHHQEHNLSCEAAALRMALSYYGINKDELTLIRYTTRDSRPAQFDAAGRLVRWGDPANAYVGNPDGHIERYSGYGVYFQPIGVAAMLAGADVLRAGSGLYGSPRPRAEVYRAVLDGHPVVAWMTNRYRRVPVERYGAY